MADGFLLGTPTLDAQVVLLAAASSTVIQTALDQLKRYMYPYYQEEADEVVLAEYLGKYGSSYCAASAMWAQQAARIIAGSTVKSYGTGAERTEFVDMAKITEFCNWQSMYYGNKCKAESGKSTGQAILVSKPTIARGAKI